ncbi:MAG TPA: plastocyanin/azurin family copper-binding protein [Solirubrobacteraceae bacterium]|jgi:plastocyanin
MNRGFLALIAGSALLLAAGCGSSSSSSSSSSATTAKSSTPTSGLKANTTPKYAAPSSSAPVQSGTVQIAYRNIAIDPDTLKVKVGSTIKWTNFDSVEHNVTSKEGPAKFASKDFGENGTYEVKALKPGVIHYLCTLHPASMNGTIEVVK